MRQFLETFPVSGETRILDVGGTPSNWMLVHHPADVTLLNIQIPQAADALPENLRYVEGDGTRLSFDDDAFDICFSNSTIEHVHTLERQAAFAREVRRVAPRLWLQTPARSFPFEPHWLGLFIHWLPRPVQRRLARNFTLWGLINRPTRGQIDELLAEYRLLSYREMKTLFPDCAIHRERFLGLTKSYVAVRQGRST